MDAKASNWQGAPLYYRCGNINGDRTGRTFDITMKLTPYLTCDSLRRWVSLGGLLNQVLWQFVQISVFGVSSQKANTILNVTHSLCHEEQYRLSCYVIYIEKLVLQRYRTWYWHFEHWSIVFEENFDCIIRQALGSDDHHCQREKTGRTFAFPCCALLAKKNNAP